MFSDFFNKKKVLITGNTGFKGSWLSMWLIRLGAKVYGLSKDIPTQPSMYEELLLDKNISHVMDDIRDLDALCALVSDIKPDIVFHLAAQPIVSLSYQNPIETLSSNIMGTAHVLEALRLVSHPCNAVIITSDKCYENLEWVWGYRETDQLGGKDIYSASKGAAELIFKSYWNSFLKQSNIKITSARAGNVIGGGDWARDRIVPDCMRAWSSGSAVEIRNPNATRPWQHVLEPISGYLALAKALEEHPEKINGESFNFGPQSEQSYAVIQILSDMSQYWNFDSPLNSYKYPNSSPFFESGLLRLNCDKALSILKWAPTFDYGEMIRSVSDWYYAFYNSDNDMYEYTMNQIAFYEFKAAEKGLAWTK
jgi:CDP-glucose 4,6-dehydratase